METLVTVIIPFYNRIRETVAAVESVLAQTHRQLELILINDGSTEDTAPLQELVARDSRIRYVATENRGPAAARNTAMDMAKGDYIAFLDSDDSFLPTKIDTQLRYMQQNALDFSHTSHRFHDLDTGRETLVNSGGFQGAVYPRMIRHCPIATPTVMLRRAFVGTSRFPESFRSGEDICFWIDLAQRTPRVGGIREPLSVVNASFRNTGYDDGKQMVGTLNIASYVLQSDIHRQHKAEVPHLLRTIVLKHQCSQLFLALHGLTLLARIAKREGLRGTLKKLVTFFHKRLLGSRQPDAA